jgi:hypothetical protein
VSVGPEAQIRAFIAQNRGVPPYQWRLPYHALIAIKAMPSEESADAIASVVELGRFVVSAAYRSNSEQNEALAWIFRTLEAKGACQEILDFAREAMQSEALAQTCVAAIANLGRYNAAAVAALRAIDHPHAKTTLRIWFEPPPPAPPPPPKKELDVAQIPVLIAELRAFLHAHDKERPPSASMPELELRNLALYGKRAATAVPVLLELAEFTSAYSFQVDRDGHNRYDGADLRALSSVVRTLGAIASDPERVIPLLKRHLEPNEKALRDAPPLQFWSTVDKYDREEDLRYAMQELVDACREALAAFG